MRKLTVVTAGLSNPSTTRSVADQLTKQSKPLFLLVANPGY